MTDPTERQLRSLFAADAAGAPSAGGLAALALHRVRHRRRVRQAVAAGLIAAAFCVGGVVATWSPSGPGVPPDAVADADTASPMDAVTDTSPPTGVGALPGNAAAECPKYSPSLIAATDFAFSGTVTAIGPSRIPPDVPGLINTTAEVTFRVDTWFHGGTGEIVRVHLEKPDLKSTDRAIDTYGIGTRLLVSGSIGDGEGYRAWGYCGNTRYYDEATAAEWAAATD